MYKTKQQKLKLLHLGASCLEMDTATILSINNNFNSVSRIFELNIQKDLSTIIKVIVRKPRYSRTDSNNISRRQQFEFRPHSYFVDFTSRALFYIMTSLPAFVKVGKTPATQNLALEQYELLYLSI